MINCAFIDFKNIKTFHFNYKKNDYIEGFLIDNDIDILFITNYINHSLDADVEDSNNNVFYSVIEEEYIIYKGIVKYNICNVILVKNIYNFNIETKYYSDFFIQPISLYSYYHGIRLICLDENTRKNNINNIRNLLTTSTIIGGIFEKKNENINRKNSQLILSNDSYYGIICKRFKTNALAVVKSKYFDNSIITCRCFKEPNILINSINKLTNFFNNF